MSDVIQAFAFTIRSFITAFFHMAIDENISLGTFLVASALLGAVIGLVFQAIQVPGKWVGRGSGGGSKGD